MMALSLMLSSCLCFLGCQVVAALSTVQCLKKTNLKTMHIVFLIDSSKSMTKRCDDKNVLETVKKFLFNMTDSLAKYNGTGAIRIALIAFDPESKPEVKVDIWGPKLTKRFLYPTWYSTDMPSAVDDAMERYLLNPKFGNRTRIIILITDAELSDKDAKKRTDVAKKARSNHVHIITLFANTTIKKQDQCPDYASIAERQEKRKTGIAFAQDISSYNSSVFMILEKFDETSIFNFVYTQICRILTPQETITTTMSTTTSREIVTTSSVVTSGQGTAVFSAPECFNKTDLHMNIVFLVDKSNSMGPSCDKKNILGSMKKFLVAMTHWLDRHNRSGKINAALITFNGDTTVDLTFSKWTIKDATKIIKEIHPQGNTIMSTAVGNATELLLNSKFVNRTRIIILITDAGFYDEDVMEQETVAQYARNNHVNIITLFANTTFANLFPCGNKTFQEYVENRRKGMDFAKNTLSFNASMFMTIENFDENKIFKFSQAQICNAKKPKPIRRTTTVQVTSPLPAIECSFTTDTSMNVVFLLDVSDSMGPDCDKKNVLRTIKTFLINMIDWLAEQDLDETNVNVALMEFHGSSLVRIKFDEWRKPGVKEEIRSLETHSAMSKILPALKRATKMLLTSSLSVNRAGVIVLITDAGEDRTSLAGLRALAENLRIWNIQIVTLFAKTTISANVDCEKSIVSSREESRRRGMEFAKNTLSYNSTMFLALEKFDTAKVSKFVRGLICVNAKMPNMVLDTTTTTTSKARVTTTTTKFKETTTTASTATPEEIVTTSKSTTPKEIVSTSPEAVLTTASITTLKKVITTLSTPSKQIITSAPSMAPKQSATASTITDTDAGITTSLLTFEEATKTSPGTTLEETVVTIPTATSEGANESWTIGMSTEIGISTSAMTAEETTVTLLGTTPQESIAASSVTSPKETDEESSPSETSEASINSSTVISAEITTTNTTLKTGVESSSTTTSKDPKATSPITTSKTAIITAPVVSSKETTTKLPVTTPKKIMTTTKPMAEILTTTSHKPIIIVPLSTSSKKTTTTIPSTTSKPFEPDTPPKAKTTTTSSPSPKVITTTTTVMINTTNVANKSLTTIAGADDDNSGLGVGAIIGIVIGALVVLGAIIGIAYYLLQPASSTPMATKGGAKGTEAGVEADEQSMAPSKK